MFYAVPRPTRDGSKVNVGRPGPGGSSGVVWKQELGGGGGGAAATTAASERGWRATTSVEKAFWEKERKIGGNDRGGGKGKGAQREGGRSSRSVQSERCEEMGLAGATVAPPVEPLSRGCEQRSSYVKL